MSRLVPANLVSLHARAEAVRREQSIPAVVGSEELHAHISAIENGMDSIDWLSRNYDGDDRNLVIRNLGLRLFNACAASTDMIFSGYYQIGAGCMRDVLETTYLLSYFLAKPDDILAWAGSSAQERRDRWKQVTIRQVIDARDGFSKQKRKEHYQTLSSLGSHPSPEGFIMLRPSGQDAVRGPFFDPTLLAVSLHELALLACLAGGEFVCHFEPKTTADTRAIWDLLNGNSTWSKRFLGLDLHAAVKARIATAGNPDQNAS